MMDYRMIGYGYLIGLSSRMRVLVEHTKPQKLLFFLLYCLATVWFTMRRLKSRRLGRRRIALHNFCTRGKVKGHVNFAE